LEYNMLISTEKEDFADVSKESDSTTQVFFAYFVVIIERL